MRLGHYELSQATQVAVIVYVFVRVRVRVCGCVHVGVYISQCALVCRRVHAGVCIRVRVRMHFCVTRTCCVNDCIWWTVSKALTTYISRVSWSDMNRRYMYGKFECASNFGFPILVG